LSRPNVSSKFNDDAARSSFAALLPSPAVCAVVIQERIVVFAFRYILWSIALLGELVVDKTELTSLFSGGDTVQTNEELGAVVGISILGVRVILTKLISGGGLGTLEPIRSFQSIGVSFAIFSICGLWPVTNTTVLVKPESGGAGVFLSSSVHAGVEDVTHTGVRVGVETIETRTQVTGALWGLEVKTVSTVNIEVMITRLLFLEKGSKTRPSGQRRSSAIPSRQS